MRKLGRVVREKRKPRKVVCDVIQSNTPKSLNCEVINRKKNQANKLTFFGLFYPVLFEVIYFVVSGHAIVDQNFKILTLGKTYSSMFCLRLANQCCV